MAQIFIAHSAKDRWLIDLASKGIRKSGVELYLAEYDDPSPLPLFEKLRSSILRSHAVIVLFTRTVANDVRTRDVVNWEITVAQETGKPVHVFKEEGADIPITIRYSVTYHTFNSPSDLESVLTKIVGIGSRLRTLEVLKIVILFAVAIFGLMILLVAASFLRRDNDNSPP